MFEVMLGGGKRRDFPTVIPSCDFGTRGIGSDILLGGNLDAGFYGEVPGSCFITGIQLAAAVNMTVGTPVNSDVNWLKFASDGKVIYYPMAAFRGSISWNQLNALNLITGNKEITINGYNFKVRLLKGWGPSGVVGTSGSNDDPATHGSEWNRLMYHIVGKPFADGRTTLASEGIQEGDWVRYTEEQLSLKESSGYNFNWCQEQTTDGRAVGRGGMGVSYMGMSDRQFNGHPSHAWRPCLELVE